MNAHNADIRRPLQISSKTGKAISEVIKENVLAYIASDIDAAIAAQAQELVEVKAQLAEARELLKRLLVMKDVDIEGEDAISDFLSRTEAK